MSIVFPAEQLGTPVPDTITLRELDGLMSAVEEVHLRLTHRADVVDKYEPEEYTLAWDIDRPYNHDLLMED